MYIVHLRLTGKLVVDFLLVFLNEHFSLGVTAENRRFRRNGVSVAQNCKYKGSSPTNHSSLYDYFVLSQCTRTSLKYRGLDRLR